MTIRGLYLSAAAVALLLTAAVPSCCPCRRAAVSTADSVRVDVRVRREVVHDTVEVVLPRESARVVVRDTASHLETSLAESDARINADGSLTHTLSNRRTGLPVGVEREVVTRDSVVWRERVVTREVEVARPLTRWQRWQIGGFRVLAIFALAVIGLFFCKLWIRTKFFS